MVKCGRVGQATGDKTGRMRFVCWITKATKTHSEYVILIAFPQQQWLSERVTTLRYTCIDSLVQNARVLILTNFSILDPRGQFLVSHLLKANNFKYQLGRLYNKELNVMILRVCLII